MSWTISRIELSSPPGVSIRMIASGARTANLAEALVLYRIGAGSYERRGGVRLLRSEVALQRRLRSEGFIDGREQLRNVGRVGPECHADTDLARARGHAVAHHAIHADGRKCHRQDGKRGEHERNELFALDERASRSAAF